MTCPICHTPNPPPARICANCDAPLELDAQYRVVGLLGRGGMNAVYRAEHAELGALHALKEIVPDPKASAQEQRDVHEQFKLEAEILARLRHDALPRVTDFFTETKTQRQYLVMELIEGETLQEILEKQNCPFEFAQVVTWLETLCEILAYLYAQTPPVIHRDLKPSNVKLTPDGKIVLIDFGIAKVAPQGSKTRGGARAYSAPYSPMEQYGSGTDARSDIYALGVTAYQLVTNQLPPAAPDRVNEAVIPPAAHNPDVPEWLSAAILKAMAREPKDRFATAQEFQRALTPPPPVVAAALLAAAAASGASVTQPLAPAIASSVTRPLARPRAGFPRWILIALVGVGLLLFVLALLLPKLPRGHSVAPTVFRNSFAPTLSLPTKFAMGLPTNTVTRPTPALALTPTARFASTPPPRSTSTPPPFRTRAAVNPSATPIPPRGARVDNWLIRTERGQVFYSGDAVPIKTRFAFEFDLTNHTAADLQLNELVVQARTVGANYVWNLTPRDTGSIGLGETRKITTISLDLGAGEFRTTLLYRGKELLDDRNAPFLFSFHIGK